MEGEEDTHKKRPKVDSIGIEYEEVRADQFLRLPNEAQLIDIHLKDEKSHPLHPRHLRRHAARAYYRAKQFAKNPRKMLRSSVSDNSGVASPASFISPPVQQIFARYGVVALWIVLIFSLFSTCVHGKGAKDEFETQAVSAQEHLQKSFDQIEAGNIGEAVKEADSAKGDLEKIKLLVQAWGQDVRYFSLVPSKTSRLVAYEQFLNGIYAMLSSLSLLNEGLKTSVDGSITTSASPEGLPQVDLVSFGNTIQKTLNQISNKLEIGKRDLTSAKGSLPENLQKPANDALGLINTYSSSLSEANQLVREGLPWISGADGTPKHILILFQNNTEIRGSGGFIGSFGVANFSEGKLTGVDFETNIYKLDKAFMANSSIPVPEELTGFVTDNKWTLHDANFAIDFDESARKVAEFYHLETGKSVDGVIALDTTLFTQLLKVIGPIPMPELEKNITDENFLSDIQYEVEIGYFEDKDNWSENAPKKILAQMMPRFTNQLVQSLKDPTKSAEIIGVLGKSLKEKHLLLNMNNNSMQSLIEEKNYAGRVEHRLSDYLFVHNTNLGGKKSSLNVKETINHSVVINPNGTIKDRVELERKHEGSTNWPDGINANLVRVLLPQGSKVTGFEAVQGNFDPHMDIKQRTEPRYKLKEEAGKDEVEYWQSTEPGNTSKSVFEYEPNYMVALGENEFYYHLYIQKAPGSVGDVYELKLTYPNGYRPVNVKNYDTFNRQVVIRQSLDEDLNIVIHFQKS